MRSEQEGTEDRGTAGESLFGNRDFLRLFAAQLTSLIGQRRDQYIALAAFAYELVGSDATVVVDTALMLRILAFVLISPHGGRGCGTPGEGLALSRQALVLFHLRRGDSRFWVHVPQWDIAEERLI